LPEFIDQEPLPYHLLRDDTDLRKALNNRVDSCGNTRGRPRDSTKAREVRSSPVKGGRKAGEGRRDYNSSLVRGDTHTAFDEIEEEDYFALSSDISPYVDALKDNGAVDDTDYFELSDDISPLIEAVDDNEDADIPAPFKVHLLFFIKVIQNLIRRLLANLYSNRTRKIVY
jgi:hypothetical protein